MLYLQDDKDSFLGTGEGFQELGLAAELLRAVGYIPVGIHGHGVYV